MKLLTPLLFRDGRSVEGLNLADDVDPARTVAAHGGHFAVHERDDSGNHFLARDLLGVHKLFFAVGRNGQVSTSNFLVDLLRAGHSIENVFSVPSGHLVRISPAESRYELVRWGQLHFGSCEAGTLPVRTLAEYARSIRAALDRTFRLLSERLAGRPVYVTLSGGLDSTTIAMLAREHFADVRAVSFALRTREEAASGTDRFFARRVARDLRLPLLEVTAEPDEVLELLDDVLVYGQDCRDFNVHCGLVNAAIARALGALHGTGPRPIVLTGDTMNELFADYAPVQLHGREYYRLPQIDRGRVRRFLVGGLDSGDREVGIFARFGVDTVQPHALCAPEYAALPENLACEEGAKSRLLSRVMHDRIPDYVCRRSKVRAQSASEGEPGGTLALLVERGIDQEALESRFAELLGIAQRSVTALVRAGRYRFSTGFPARSAEVA